MIKDLHQQNMLIEEDEEGLKNDGAMEIFGLQYLSGEVHTE